MPLTNSPNHFLLSLSPQDRGLLQPHLKPLRLPLGAPLFKADDIISNVYFPYNGIMSMVVGVSSGQFVEAGIGTQQRGRYGCRFGRSRRSQYGHCSSRKHGDDHRRGGLKKTSQQE